MCGILVSLSRHASHTPDKHTFEFLRARGPDAFRSHSLCLPSHRTLTFYSSVLALRGDSIQEQPLVDAKTGSVLCWNGEAWKLAGQPVLGNDGLQLFDSLITAAGETSPSSRIAEVLTGIEGPFAFVFYDALSSTLYYGRDRLGRRSLIVESDPETLTISSIATSTKPTPVECSVDEIHYLSLRDTGFDVRPLAWRSAPLTINKEIPRQDIAPTPTLQAVDNQLEHLRESLRPRVLNIPVHNLLHHNPQCSRIAILFSGGLDCTLLARLTHDILPPTESIDLLNVAFENPRSMSSNPRPGQSPYETCPDRITGRSSFAELTRTCPHRTWRFIAIDIPYTETTTHKPTIIRLMRPHNTEMDLSIAMALYFAARGQGHILPLPDEASPPPSHPYTTTARVLLSGLGADELFAGYTRHATAFSRGGYGGLVAELQLDFARIGSRNLGRDDRVLSHWGKEVRYPFLDEGFVAFALGLGVWEKCGWRAERTAEACTNDDENVVTHEGDEGEQSQQALDPAKMLLRLAAWNLGMPGAAREKKRAIQFGARTAKMELGGGRKKGTDILLAVED